jgi:aminopeptidase-like protein
LREEIPGLVLHEVPSGSEVLDWVVPDEWNVRAATLTAPDGEVIADFDVSNIHLVGYSESVDIHLDLEQLQPHLHSIPEQPTAIPYVTSYYNRGWGFCIAHRVRERPKPGTYHAVIDSSREGGSLTYGELLLPGESSDEVFISTYVCHPSLANNELSGPMVATGLAQWLMKLPRRHYSYRIVFVPETIGAVTYIHQNLPALKERVIAGFQLTCIGDDRRYTYLASRDGNLRIDRIAKRVLASRENVVHYSYLSRGSDERQYCSPGVDLPLISLMRSRYADYPEYHTSLDDLNTVVTPTGLQGGLDVVRECIEVLEREQVLIANQRGEPQLGRRGLYHTITKKTTPEDVMLRTNVLAYADGQHDVSDMAELLNVDSTVIAQTVYELVDHGLIRLTQQSRTNTPGEPG